MSQTAKVLYTARTDTTGGRENGPSRSSDGRLDIKLSVPGSARIGANPEQLFAAGWSASFESAIALVAQKENRAAGRNQHRRRSRPEPRGRGYFLSARLTVKLSGLERDVAKDLVAEAQENCPYSKATRGKIEVTIKLV